MRTEEETKEIISALATSPDFIAALQSCIDRWKKVKTLEVNSVDISFFMFCEGYLSCLNYMETKDKLRSFQYKADYNHSAGIEE